MSGIKEYVVCHEVRGVQFVRVMDCIVLGLWAVVCQEVKGVQFVRVRDLLCWVIGSSVSGGKGCVVCQVK